MSCSDLYKEKSGQKVDIRKNNKFLIRENSALSTCAALRANLTYIRISSKNCIDAKINVISIISIFLFGKNITLYKLSYFFHRW